MANEDVPIDTLELTFAAIGGLRDGSSFDGPATPSEPTGATNSLKRVVPDEEALEERVRRNPAAAVAAATASSSSTSSASGGWGGRSVSGTGVPVSISFALPLPADAPITGLTGDIALFPTVSLQEATSSASESSSAFSDSSTLTADGEGAGDVFGTATSIRRASAAAAASAPPSYIPVVSCPLAFTARYGVPRVATRTALRAAERRPLLLEVHKAVFVSHF